MPALLLVLLLLVTAGLPASAAPSRGPAGAKPSKAAGKASLAWEAFDTTAIRAYYMDGDFPVAIEKLEEARKRGQLRTHADSVFAFKHLGVMYAATYATVEKGKHFMMQLLTIEPSVRIMDMYASDMIYMIFRNVQAEMEHMRGRPRMAAEPLAPRPDSSAPPPPPRSSRGKRPYWPYWTLGSLAAAAGTGAAVYFLFFSGKPSEPVHYSGGL